MKENTVLFENDLMNNSGSIKEVSSSALTIKQKNRNKEIIKKSKTQIEKYKNEISRLELEISNVKELSKEIKQPPLPKKENKK